MMQFSISPKRVLSEKSFKTVLNITKLHGKYADLILELAKNASTTGEPVMRYMEYEFPNEGFELVNGQFMLGNDILVAPILEKGATYKCIKFPSGSWKGDDGSIYTGGCEKEISVDMSSIMYFVRI